MKISILTTALLLSGLTFAKDPLCVRNYVKQGTTAQYYDYIQKNPAE